jgi:hypothetical protein
MNRKSTPIPEAIPLLQRQLDQFRSTQPRRTKLPESFMACRSRPGPATRCVFRRAPTTTGLSGAEETARRSLPTPAESNQAGICRVGRAGPRTTRRMCDRVGVLWWEQDANPVEDHRSARLDEPAACLARCREMIQITAQMRVLVAIEPVDGRKGIDSLGRVNTNAGIRR